mmetsp:Transcript_12694/g.33130  ORF Transcript_12694/g.33130 Transcript_12694/m.33130 type:complete len:381 (+) Transcript_12694:160-1302(+)
MPAGRQDLDPHCTERVEHISTAPVEAKESPALAFGRREDTVERIVVTDLLGFELRRPGLHLEPHDAEPKVGRVRRSVDNSDPHDGCHAAALLVEVELSGWTRPPLAAAATLECSWIGALFLVRCDDLPDKQTVGVEQTFAIQRASGEADLDQPRAPRKHVRDAAKLVNVRPAVAAISATRHCLAHDPLQHGHSDRRHAHLRALKGLKGVVEVGLDEAARNLALSIRLCEGLVEIWVELLRLEPVRAVGFLDMERCLLNSHHLGQFLQQPALLQRGRAGKDVAAARELLHPRVVGEPLDGLIAARGVLEHGRGHAGPLVEGESLLHHVVHGDSAPRLRPNSCRVKLDGVAALLMDAVDRCAQVHTRSDALEHAFRLKLRLE